MSVLAFDPQLDAKQARARGAVKVTLEELLERSDFVQLTCPLSAATEGLIGAAEFARMKESAFFITTTRGPVHDEEALYEALVAGRIAGAGLDVFHVEPPSPDNPLLGLENVVATPHVAGITVESGHHIAVATAEQWLTIFAGKVPPRLINPAAWSRYSAFGGAPRPPPSGIGQRREESLMNEPMAYETILVEQRDRTVCITLNRPERLNAISDTMIHELHDVYQRVESDSDVWTMIITGNGRALCSGGDVGKAPTA